MRPSRPASIPQTMPAITVARPGGPEVLELVELPVPEPRPGEVLIAVAAAGLNGADMFQRQGNYDPPPDASPLLGLEAAGTVLALGENADPALLGQKVVALCNGGGYAGFVAVPAGQVLPLPDGWTMAEGASLPETVFTIQQTVIERAGLKSGRSILIHGAAGGIGGAAIQLARLHGAVPFASVSTPEKAAYAISLGAEAAIVYPHQDFVDRIGVLTRGKGVDVILDVVGGANMARNLDAIAIGGTIIQLSAIAGPGEIHPGRLVRKQLTWFGSILRPQSSEDKARWAHALRQKVWPAIAAGRFLKPRLRVFPFAGATAAHRAFEDPQSYGKIVLELAP